MMKTLEKLCARTGKAIDHPPVLMAFVGDSVTHGCFEVYIDHLGEIGIVYEPENAYPARLKKRLDRLYPAGAVSVLNCGVSGDGAYGGLKRLERDALCHRPDLVVLAFGLNDAMGQDVEAGLHDYCQAMTQMISQTLKTGAECIVLTPNHMCGYVSSALKEDALRAIALRAAEVQNEGILARYVQAARECARAQGIPVADAYALWDQMKQCGVDTTGLLSNHINHPTRDGHDVFVGVLLQTLMSPEYE